MRYMMLAPILLLTSVAFANDAEQQQQPATPKNHRITLSDAIEASKAGKAEPYELELIAQANAVETIPELEKRFARTGEDDPILKSKLAEVLVKLGDKSNVYWIISLQLQRQLWKVMHPSFCFRFAWKDDRSVACA